MVSKYRAKMTQGLYRMAIRPAVAARLERLSRRLGAESWDSWSVRLGRIALAAGKTLEQGAARPGRAGRSAEATVNRAQKKKTWMREALERREADRRRAAEGG